jgi:hypothetical protein
VGSSRDGAEGGVVTDEPNRDHRCRTCEHFMPNIDGGAECSCTIPAWAKCQSSNLVTEGFGRECEAYSYIYRRARLVK